jgi:hypothetical protein
MSDGVVDVSARSVGGRGCRGSSQHGAVSMTASCLCRGRYTGVVDYYRIIVSRCASIFVVFYTKIEAHLEVILEP